MAKNYGRRERRLTQAAQFQVSAGASRLARTRHAHVSHRNSPSSPRYHSRPRKEPRLRVAPTAESGTDRQYGPDSADAAGSLCSSSSRKVQRTNSTLWAEKCRRRRGNWLTSGLAWMQRPRGTRQMPTEECWTGGNPTWGRVGRRNASRSGVVQREGISP